MQGEGEKPRRQQVHVQQETGYHDYDRLANGSPAYHLPSLPEVLPYVHPSGSQNSTESPLNIGESHASSTVRYLVIPPLRSGQMAPVATGRTSGLVVLLTIDHTLS